MEKREEEDGEEEMKVEEGNGEVKDGGEEGDGRGGRYGKSWRRSDDKAWVGRGNVLTSGGDKRYPITNVWKRRMKKRTTERTRTGRRTTRRGMGRTRMGLVTSKIWNRMRGRGGGGGE